MDLREQAIKTICRLNRLAETFPPRSPGRRALRRASRKIKLDYVATEVDKKRLIILAVGEGNSRLRDIEVRTGLDRTETEDLTLELVAARHLTMTDDLSSGGRPGRSFKLVETRK